MKKSLKKATAILLALLMVTTTISALPFTVSAAEVTDDSVSAVSGTTGDCTWELNENGTLTISGNGAMGNYSYSNYAPWKGNKVKSVIIENGVTNIGNYAFDHCEHLTSITISDSVTSIGEVAFSCCSNLTSVTIPDYVTGIGRFTFINCSRLTSVNIPNSVTSIGNSVFKGCRNLTSVDIPDSVTSIGSDVFSCSGLSNITVNNNNTNYCSIDGNLYDKNATVLIQYATGKTDSSFITPDTVTSIGDGAFRGCSSLTNVTILNSVTSIGDYVFESCKNLISVTISESVTSIGRNAFYGCSSLINVTIPNSVTSIDKYAFFCCTSLTSVDIPDSVISIGYWAFNGCSSLTSVYIPESVTMIGREAFSCRNISNISVDNNNPNYLSIDGNLYYKNKNAISLIQYAIGKTPKSFLIPDYVTGIGYRAFDNCSTLTDVTIPSSVISIGEYAFYHCDNLKSITIPNSVESIGEGAFQQCKSLTDITIPNSVTSISNSAFLYTAEDFTITGYEGSAAETFANNYGYTFVMINEPSNYTYQMLSDGTVEITGYTGNGDKISIPSEFNGLTVTSISNSAFVNCKNLTAVTIPNSVINISDSAFKDCSFLTSVTIPNSVTVIGDYVFSGCVSLSNIQVDKNNTAYCSIDGNLYNKAATILIQYAIGKTSASFTIPDSVTSISSRAFSECNNLVSVTIPYFVANICDRAFLNCHNLSNITIPNSVINIDECAFLNCNNLTSLTIPKSVSSIGEYAFGYNNYESGFVPDKVDDFTITGYRESVAEIYANENGFNFLMVDDSCDFEYKVCDNGTAEITKYKGNGGIVTIPSIIDGYAVTSLGYLSFSYCTNLSSVYIPDSVINIGARAFYSCNNLATVHISKSVTNIGYEAFYQCSKLLSVTIPDSVTKIREAAFSCCSSLSNITVDSNNEFYCSIDGNLYNKNGSTLVQYTISKSASSFTIPNSVTHIEVGAFANCSNLTSINIPNSVISIGVRAFYGCSGLTSIVIPSSVIRIGDLAFYRCVNLETIYIPDSLANIGCNAFGNTKWYDNKQNGIVYAGNVFCNYKGDVSTVTSLTLKEETLGIAAGALSNCENLTEIEIPEGVKIIGAGAFFGCKKLEKGKIIPHSITSIGSYAFAFCKNLESIIIPDSIKSIGHYAFLNCSLTGVAIPPSVKTIGKKAFGYSCFSDKSFTNYKDFEEEVEKSDSDIVFNKKEGFLIEGTSDSEAIKYASENQIGFSEKSFEPTKYVFNWGTDNWKFNNDASSFSDATIQDGIIDTLAGSSYFNVGDDKYNNKTIAQKVKTGPGKCFGMTVSEILVKQGLLNIDSVLNIDSESSHEDEPKKNLSEYSISNNNNLITVISFIQALQNYGKYGQIRRQEGQSYQTTKEASQKTFIKAAESELKNNDSLVLIEYAYQDSDPNNIDTNKVLLNEKYHAVLGYGIESGSYEYNDKTYEHRILIADPNYLTYKNEDKKFDNACIYYNDDGSWICPCWNTETTKCYWNNVESSSTNRVSENYTGRIKNIMKIYSLTDVVDLVYTSTDYVAGITIFNKSKNKTTIEKVPGTGDQNPENSEIIPYSLCDENENDAELYALPDATADYSVSFDNKPTNYSMMMDYENVSYFAKVENGTSTLVKPEGYINIEGSNATYSITMMTDNSKDKSDWYSITVSGNNANNVTLTKREDGYLIKTDSSEDSLGYITITAKNNSGKITVAYNTQSSSAIIKKDENNIAVMVNSNEDGDYDKKLSPMGDVNGNGVVDINDVTAIQYHLAELEPIRDNQLAFADVNGNGAFDINDATQLQKNLAGLTG